MSIKSSFGRRHAAAARREVLLAEFERSGLSAAEFARQGLSYTTFCGWRKRWERAKLLPSFVQVEVAPCAGTEELVIEVGAQARMRISRVGQIELVATLIQALGRTSAC